MYELIDLKRTLGFSLKVPGNSGEETRSKKPEEKSFGSPV